MIEQEPPTLQMSRLRTLGKGLRIIGLGSMAPTMAALAEEGNAPEK